MSQTTTSFKVRLRKTTTSTTAVTSTVSDANSVVDKSRAQYSSQLKSVNEPSVVKKVSTTDFILSDIGNKMNVAYENEPTPKLKTNSVKSFLNVPDTSTHSNQCTGFSLNYSNMNVQSNEIKRMLKAFEQNSELIKKLQNTKKNPPIFEFSEPSDEPSSLGDKSSVENNSVVNKQGEPVLPENKFISVSSADESVVQISKDRFEPKYVKEINFEILKLPNSQQKIYPSRSLDSDESVPQSKSSTSKSNLSSKKKLGSSSSIDKQPLEAFPAKNSAKLKPRNLDPCLASAREVSADTPLGQQYPSKSVSSLATINEDKSIVKTKEKNLLTTSMPQLNTINKNVKCKLPSNDQVPVLKSLKHIQAKSDKALSSVTKKSDFLNIQVNKRSYLVLNKIGRGGSSIVYQVFDPESKYTFALKVVDLSGSDESVITGFRNEIKLLSSLRHCKRVVRMYDYEFQNNNKELLIVMEKGDDDLLNVLKSYCKTETKLSPHLIRFYWQEMLKVVNEIHKRNIVHSDLKPVNFILVSGKLKLIDFGIANAIQSNKTSVYKDCIIGTVDYMAPESFQKNARQNGKAMVKYNQKADIWSLGIILYNLVYGYTPFSHIKDNFKKSAAIVNCDIDYSKIDDKLLLDVIKQCLQRDPNKRPTAAELLSHQYLTQMSATKQHSSDDSKKANSSNESQSNIRPELLSQISNLTPNSLKCFSKILESFSKKS